MQSGKMFCIVVRQVVKVLQLKRVQRKEEKAVVQPSFLVPRHLFALASPETCTCCNDSGNYLVDAHDL